mmetsp:Transcript_100912/g.140206  ORF Transcript_100912/g.140206 Transcript_100912/m.140206 type:complete len:337 (+) Transcript_100912:36-1046(+)
MAHAGRTASEAVLVVLNVLLEGVGARGGVPEAKGRALGNEVGHIREDLGEAASAHDDGLVKLEQHMVDPVGRSAHAALVHLCGRQGLVLDLLAEHLREDLACLDAVHEHRGEGVGAADDALLLGLGQRKGQAVAGGAGNVLALDEGGGLVLPAEREGASLGHLVLEAEELVEVLHEVGGVQARDAAGAHQLLHTGLELQLRLVEHCLEEGLEAHPLGDLDDHLCVGRLRLDGREDVLCHLHAVEHDGEHDEEAVHAPHGLLAGLGVGEVHDHHLVHLGHRAEGCCLLLRADGHADGGLLQHAARLSLLGAPDPAHPVQEVSSARARDSSKQNPHGS